MNISFENASEVQGLLTIKLEKADYSENVEKSLKAYSKKASMPGFRPGMVPMGLIRKMYGKSIKAEEINKILQEKIFGYIKENQIKMLGEPLPNDVKEDANQDIESDDLTFYFDIALAPKFDATPSKDDTVPYYEIKISDEMIDSQTKSYTQQNGKYDSVDSYQDNDVVKGTLVELNADGSVKEDGINVANAVVMPSYFKNDDQKKLFQSVNKGDVVVFNPSKAYDGSAAEMASLLSKQKEDVEGIVSDFSFTIEEITRFEEAELNQDLFDKIFGKDVVKSADEFRSKISESLKSSFTPDSDFRFLLDVREFLKNKVGKLSFADDLLKRIMLSNSKDADLSKIEENYEKSIDELTWHLIKEQLVEKNGIKIQEEDVKFQAREATRAQFAQYGMMNIPEELLDNYAKEIMKKQETIDGLVNRAAETKLATTLKQQFKLKKKTVTIEEFNKLFETEKK